MVLEGIVAFVTEHPFITFAIIAALVFDFVNGFHDSANAIATVVATKVLTPAQAVTMAGVFNFIGPFLLGTAVAATIGKGIITTSTIDPAVLTGLAFAGLLGAIIWDLITWWFGLPTSSSHALVGGLVGAALAAVGPSVVIWPAWPEFQETGRYVLYGMGYGLLAGAAAFVLSRIRMPRGLLWPFVFAGAIVLGWLDRGTLTELSFSRDAIGMGLHFFVQLIMGGIAGGVLWVMTQRPMPARTFVAFLVFAPLVAIITGVLTKSIPMGGLTKTLIFMIVSPMLGFLAGFLLASLVAWIGHTHTGKEVNVWSKRLQLFSSAFYALTHGTNDAQKTMGVIAVLLIAAGTLGASGGADLDIPTWVIVAAAAAMGLGTMFGGWRIVQTMASRITHLRPWQGFAAETGGGLVLTAMASAGIPVSTTHAITSSIMGVGAMNRASAVRWVTGRRIVWAWVLTIPGSAIVAFASYYTVTPRLLTWYRANPALTGGALLVLAIAALGFLWYVRRGESAKLAAKVEGA